MDMYSPNIRPEHALLKGALVLEISHAQTFTQNRSLGPSKYKVLEHKLLEILTSDLNSSCKMAIISISSIS